MSALERVLPPAQRQLLARLSQRPEVWEGFYLAGGTALALHLGHRLSWDFDLFRTEPFDPAPIRRALEELAPPVAIKRQSDREIQAEAMGVQVSVFHYPYPLLDAPAEMEGLPFLVAGLRDLAAMKIAAIGQRGVKRDYVDLFFLCKRVPLVNWLRAFETRYPRVRESLSHFLKALVWFDDAERTPMPSMLESAQWEDVKAYFDREAPAAARELLGWS